MCSSRLIPMFRGNFSKNRNPYLGIFPQTRYPFFAILPQKTQNFQTSEPRKILKNRPRVRDFFMNMRPMFRDFLQKTDPKLWHIPVCLNMWVSLESVVLWPYGQSLSSNFTLWSICLNLIISWQKISIIIDCFCTLITNTDAYFLNYNVNKTYCNHGNYHILLC